MKKKLTPASICSQKKWASLPVAKKNNLRKMLGDRDKDGVPDKYDCRPKNKCKQETFLSDDAAYLASHDDIYPQDLLETGANGSVYSVKGNKNLVVKFAKGVVDRGEPLKRRCADANSFEDEIAKEGELYNQFNLNDEPLFIPTKVIKITGSEVDRSRSFTGLVRPRIMIVNNRKRIEYSLTTRQLNELCAKLKELSSKGFKLADGLQIGIDRTGRVLQFDVGSIEKCLPSEAYKFNNLAWAVFLEANGFVKLDEFRSRQGRISLEEGNDLVNPSIRKYGTISEDKYRSR
jgi:hypothetical protein